MRKKLLFMEDLLNFFQTNNLTKFSSSDSGYKLCVQVPATFEVDDKVDDAHRGMMKIKVRVFHLDLNRNGSFVSKEAAQAAMPTIKNRPVMAYIHQRDDGEWDFEAHNMIVNTDEDGNDYFEYQERQVGSFDEGDPFFEYDKELDKTFVTAYAYISEDYTRACDIIRRKGGTKNSVELSIEELAYNAKDNYLDLQKFYVSASTLLGSYDDGTEVAEGMLGSRADIVDFSEKNNSVLSNSKLINEIAEAVAKRLGNIQVDNSTDYTDGKEESGLKKENLEFDETEVKATEEAVATETPEVVNDSFEEETTDDTDSFEEEKKPEGDEVAEETEDDEAEQEVEEFDGDTPVADNTPAADDTPAEDEATENTSTEDETAEETQSVSAIEDEDSTEAVSLRVPRDTMSYTVNVDGVMKNFAVSLKDKLNAITILVNDTYSEADNAWYDVDAYEDDGKYCVMHDWWNDRHYKQEYTVKKDVYSLKGDRVQVFAQYLTADEIGQLDKMKSNYSSIESELNSYKSKELHAAREAVLTSADYSVMKDFAEFKELKDHMDEYSVEDLTNKADLVYAKFMKSNYSTFSNKEQNKHSVVFMTSGSNTEEERLPYGGLFKNFKGKN